jgi:succinate dehydrogenase / fumarate reductase flavoprotein subunit
MPEFQRFSYDVLVIEQAGLLRAAIEAGPPARKWGLCVRRPAKRTVMAEGGIVVAHWPTRRSRQLRVHFADTMRGGQYLNNWRMAELHAVKLRMRTRT